MTYSDLGVFFQVVLIHSWTVLSKRLISRKTVRRRSTILVSRSHMCQLFYPLPEYSSTPRLRLFGILPPPLPFVVIPEPTPFFSSSPFRPVTVVEPPTYPSLLPLPTLLLPRYFSSLPHAFGGVHVLRA